MNAVTPSSAGARPIETRPLGLGDLTDHANLRSRLWDDPVAQHEVELRELSRRPTFAAFGAFEGETLVGFAEASLREYVDGIDAQPAGYLEGIYVVPDRRRAGIAVALTRAVMAWAQHHGCTDLGSDALIEDVESHAWHRRAGFAEIERVVRFARPIEAATA